MNRRNFFAASAAPCRVQKLDLGPSISALGESGLVRRMGTYLTTREASCSSHSAT